MTQRLLIAARNALIVTTVACGRPSPEQVGQASATTLPNEEWYLPTADGCRL
jgi:hypothetical protein